MMILLGMGVIITLITLYLGRKVWYALHKAVGITPGVLTYQDARAPLLLSELTWQNLVLQPAHLHLLSDEKLRQLQRIDDKITIYQRYQQALDAQNITPAITEQQFILHKLLHQRLPEMLASHYHVTQSKLNISQNTNHISHTAHDDNSLEAGQLLQDALEMMENRLDDLLGQIDNQHLQDLRVMRRYMDSQH